MCHPRHVEPEPDEFFVNQGDGRFVESSRRMGLFGTGNKGLGVVIADLETMTTGPISMWRTIRARISCSSVKTDSILKESSLLLGGAVSATGEPQRTCGIAFGDYDGNGPARSLRYSLYG